MLNDGANDLDGLLQGSTKRGFLPPSGVALDAEAVVVAAKPGEANPIVVVRGLLGADALGSTGDLVALCSAAPDNGIGTAALNFCEGYLHGAVTVEMLNMSTFRGPKLFCLPNPPPARSEAMSEFVSWAQAAPDRMSQSPTDGVFGFLRDHYPCAASR